MKLKNIFTNTEFDSTKNFWLLKAATKPVTNESILSIKRGAQCF
jgi:hypothetical protein